MRLRGQTHPPSADSHSQRRLGPLGASHCSGGRRFARQGWCRVWTAEPARHNDEAREAQSDYSGHRYYPQGCLGSAAAPHHRGDVFAAAAVSGARRRGVLNLVEDGAAAMRLDRGPSTDRDGRGGARGRARVGGPVFGSRRHERAFAAQRTRGAGLLCLQAECPRGFVMGTQALDGALRCCPQRDRASKQQTEDEPRAVAAREVGVGRRAVQADGRGRGRAA